MVDFTAPAPTIRIVDILRHDTLKTIALRELGTAARWVDLVILNELRPPYIGLVPAAGVLVPGDFIKIPAAATGVHFETDPRSIYGTDLLLAKGRLGADGSGDLALLTGVANLVQALRHHVIVDKKELGFHPNYGCFVRQLIGVGSGRAKARLAAWYVKSAVLEDRRVDSVPFAEGEASGDNILVTVKVIPIAGKPVDMEILI